MLPTPRDGIREDYIEPFIYKNELQSITQETRDKLQILTEIMNSIVSIEKEESEIKNELNKIILKGDKEHGPLAERRSVQIPYKLRAGTNGYKEKKEI